MGAPGLCRGQLPFGVLDLASAALAASIFCCLNTEDLVGAGPLLILPLPVVFLTKCVSGVSLKRKEFHQLFKEFKSSSNIKNDTYCIGMFQIKYKVNG